MSWSSLTRAKTRDPAWWVIGERPSLLCGSPAPLQRAQLNRELSCPLVVPDAYHSLPGHRIKKTSTSHSSAAAVPTAAAKCASPISAQWPSARFPIYIARTKGQQQRAKHNTLNVYQVPVAIRYMLSCYSCRHKLCIS